MHDKLNENIDDIFRKGLSQTDESDKYESWADMELLLDKDKKKRRFFILWFWGLFSILSTLIFLTFVFNPTTIGKETQSTTTLDTSSNSTIVPKQSNSAIENNEGEKANSLEAAFGNIDNKKATRSPLNSNIYNGIKPKTNTSISDRFEYNETIVKASNLNRKEKQKFDKNTVESKRLTSGLNQTTELNRIEFYSENTGRDSIQIKNRSTISIIETLKSKLSIVELDKRNLVETEINPWNKNVEKSPAQFLIGLKFSVEESTSKFKERNNLDKKYGLETSLRFSKKWSLGLGLNYVLKKYETNAYNYTAPPGFWTRSIMPKTIHAECKILEIPIHLGYYFKGYERNTFFTTVALNSYIMLNEDYLYTYAIPEPDLREGWSGRNTAQHFLGITDFTLGYQLTLNEDFYLQASSYVQVPVSKIGFGQIKLWSKGITFAALYKL